jgi:DNA-directed RNA polymerase specialized sigma subunit
MEEAEKIRRQRVQTELESRNLGQAMRFLRSGYPGEFTTTQIADTLKISKDRVRKELNAVSPRELKRLNKGFEKGARHGAVITDVWQYQLYGQERDQDLGR